MVNTFEPAGVTSLGDLGMVAEIPLIGANFSVNQPQPARYTCGIQRCGTHIS